jgi:hypothetical protein
MNVTSELRSVDPVAGQLLVASVSTACRGGCTAARRAAGLRLGPFKGCATRQSGVIVMSWYRVRYMAVLVGGEVVVLGAGSRSFRPPWCGWRSGWVLGCFERLCSPSRPSAQ